MKKIKIGIVGCGVIGSALAENILKYFRDKAEVRYLCDLHAEKTRGLSRKLGKRVRTVSFEKLIKGSDFVVEAASPRVAQKVATEVLKLNKKALILSVGGLISKRKGVSFLDKGRGKIWVPSGAVAGIDGLLAARESGIQSVKLRIQKPPAGLNEAPYFKKKPFPKLSRNAETRVFHGNALGAVKGFPKNANVAALLSLAGIGPRKTSVEIWTSKKYARNSHRIEIVAKSGKLKYEIENVPSRLNPKTSALAVYSALATLRKIFNSRVLGT